MTPRALLTAIGATAMGFAIVITSVAGSEIGPTPTAQTTASVSGDAAYTVSFAPLDAVPPAPRIPSMHRVNVWNEACEIAL